MKIAGIVTEYNPFHNGHKHQIDVIKSECDGVIAIMSGGFVQRGDAACTDKRTRAKAAALCGCDLVLELPVCCVLNSAQLFSYGAVSLLDRLNVVDTLYFGAECPDTKILKNAAYALEDESVDISDKIKESLSHGVSFPKARSNAYSSLIDTRILSEPNNILGIEYIRAIMRLKSKIIPYALPREGVFHDSGANGKFASASHIRKLISEGVDYSEYVPCDAYDIYSRSDMTYNIKNIDALILGTLRMKTPDDFKGISDVSEGIENRILEAAKRVSSFAELCDTVKTKRYTMSRIRRIILSSVLGIHKIHTTDYARVLAMTDMGKRILREIKSKSQLTIITKTALYKGNSLSFMLDLRADDIHALCSENSRAGGKDFKISPSVI